MSVVLVFKTSHNVMVGKKAFPNFICRYVEMCCFDDGAIGSGVGIPLWIQGSRCICDCVHLRWKLRHGLSPLWMLGHRQLSVV